MKNSEIPDRRRFLKVAAAVGAVPAASCTHAGRRWRFFTEEQAATVAAMCDQIIPPDQDPGAVAAGAVHFIDRQLKGHYAYLQESYLKGIEEIEGAARQKFGKRFPDLASEQQIELLKEREQSAFFRMVVDHTMQGFYGDPRHGGNRDFASWKMMGIPNAPVRGRQQYDFTKS